MSGKAFGWAREVEVSGGITAKAVLLLMADYANPEFTCFPSVATLARELSAGETTIKRAIGTLEADKLITRELRFTASGKSSSNLYRLAVSDYAHTPPQGVQIGPPMGSKSDPSRGPDRTPHPSAADPSNRTSTLNQGCSDEHPTGERDVVSPSIKAFEAVLIEWIAMGEPNSRTNTDEARAAWIAVVDGGVDADVLAKAARCALAEDADFKRRGAPGLQRWLGDMQFQAWIVRAEAAPAIGASRFADEPIRRIVVAERDEDFARSYLDPARWDGERKAILTPTGFAADKLNREVRRHLVGMVSIIESAGKS